MYPTAYIEYLAHFHGTRDYFECHEVLEEHWKSTEPKKRESVWVLLIQIAVCLYHYRRGNLKGASILISRCLRKLDKLHMEVARLGIDRQELLRQITQIKENIYEDIPYQSIRLPIKDKQLLELVHTTCTKWGVSFGEASDLSNRYLINKHTLRNRMD